MWELHLGHWQLTAQPDGLTHLHIAGSALMPWSDFNRVESSDSAVYVFAGERAVVAPLRAFRDHGAAHAFISYVSQRIEDLQRSA